MKTLRVIAAAATLASACIGFAAPAAAEFKNGEVVRLVILPDGTRVY